MQQAAQQSGLLECQECGLRQRLPDRIEEGNYFCRGCGHKLHAERAGWLSASLALTLAGLILFLVSNLFPFMALEFGGLQQQTTLLSGVGILVDNQQYALALLIFGTIFLFPLLELLGLLWLLSAVVSGRRLPGLKWVMHQILAVSSWNMMEVFLLAVLVTSVKLRELADVVPGVALYAFFALVLCLTAAQSRLNRRRLWQFLEPQDLFRSGSDDALSACPQCHALVGGSLLRTDRDCPRCGSVVHARIPRSLQKTAAFLLAAIILYIPANVLPIMITTSLGQSQADTILSGVLYLLHGDTWPLAVVVFVASVLVPVSKIIILGYLWWTTLRGSEGRLMQRMKLYRLTEFVGHWSMVDVYVVILMVALVQFGFLANVEAGGAALAFGGVVVLTMLAARSFDPRLIWDIHYGHRASRVAG